MARKPKAKRATEPRYRRGIPGDYTDRDRKICEMHAAGGMSLEAIGATFDPVLSGERVRQIVAHAERRAMARNSESRASLREAFLRGGVTGRGY
jgi:hypothetical protein